MLSRATLGMVGIAGGLMAACLASMLLATGGALSMPLDDAYIFFQYARRVVEGAPLTYHPGGGFSAGATSLLTVFAHAAGYLVGFRGGAMAVFALLLGWASLAWAAHSAWRLGVRLCPRVAWLPAALLLTSGPLVWGFMSGMDLPLFVALALAWASAWPEPNQAPPRRFYLFGGLLGLARPDAVFLVVSAFLLAVWNRSARWPWIWPLAGTAFPFALQFAFTGRAQSASMDVKSVLSMPGFTEGAWIASAMAYASKVTEGILGGGLLADAGAVAANNESAAALYVLPFALLFCVLGGVPGAWNELRTRQPGPHLLLLVWIAALIAAQAFTVPKGWHWNRYLMPVYAFLFPLLAVGVDRVGRLVESVWPELEPPHGARAIGGALLLLALPGTVFFVLAFGRNCADIRFMHIELAERLNAGDPATPRLLGLHDAGALAYFSEFPTLDLEGLTDAEFREAARLGAAGVWERLESLPAGRRPDVLAATPVWFDAVFFRPHRLAAVQRLYRPSIVAGNPMNVYLADWSLAGAGDLPRDPALAGRLAGKTLRLTLDVADVTSEQIAGYSYRILDGAYEDLLRLLRSADGAEIMDGGRMISGSERFRVEGLDAGRDLLLVARTHAPFRLWVETSEGSAGIWSEGGEANGWRETAFVIPGRLVSGTSTDLRIGSDDPHHSAYGSFHYWVYQ